jgi:hypothetical protein
MSYTNKTPARTLRATRQILCDRVPQVWGSGCGGVCITHHVTPANRGGRCGAGTVEVNGARSSRAMRSRARRGFGVLRLVEAFTSLCAEPSCGSELHPAAGHSETESGDKSPHSKLAAVCCGSFLGVWLGRYAMRVSPHPQPLSPETSSLFLDAAVPMDWLGPIEYWSGEKACLRGEGSQTQGALRVEWRHS